MTPPCRPRAARLSVAIAATARPSAASIPFERPNTFVSGSHWTCTETSAPRRDAVRCSSSMASAPPGEEFNCDATVSKNANLSADAEVSVVPEHFNRRVFFQPAEFLAEPALDVLVDQAGRFGVGRKQVYAAVFE